jgi:hypothetical protein
MRNEKVNGIKSVDFKIKAFGHGVVNWNGPTNLAQENGTTVDNHTLPKLRGYTNLSGKVKDTGYKYRKEPTDIDFSKNPLYISQNCIRHHLFRNQAFDIHYAKDSTLEKVLASITGLVRGYVVPASQCKRTSPLLIEDFVDQLGNGNFEQFGQAGERDSSSFYSKTTFGDTEYVSYGSISIEQMQFISLDDKFDRKSMTIEDGQGEVIAQSIQDFIQSLNTNLLPKATFHENYVRNGTIYEEGENGILLNEDAIQSLVETTLEKLKELSIRQAKSYMYVDEMTVDFNDSSKMMRIKQDSSQIVEQKDSDYAVYFYSN